MARAIEKRRINLERIRRDYHLPHTAISDKYFSIKICKSLTLKIVDLIKTSKFYMDILVMVEIAGPFIENDYFIYQIMGDDNIHLRRIISEEKGENFILDGVILGLYDNSIYAESYAGILQLDLNGNIIHEYTEGLTYDSALLKFGDKLVFSVVDYISEYQYDPTLGIEVDGCQYKFSMPKNSPDCFYWNLIRKFFK